MFSLMDDNIFNIAVEGVFDDCQDMVKAVSNDLDFKRQYKIGTVNSINWARLLAQVVYYFAGYFQATQKNTEKVSFTVPSGNFGNVCAGHVARMMGLPIARLVVATNENDVLDEFFKTGVYRFVRSSPTRMRPPARRWTSPRRATSSALCLTCWGAMARASSRCLAMPWGVSASLTWKRTPPSARPPGATVLTVAKAPMLTAWRPSRTSWTRHGMMIDTHTADGVKVAREHVQAGVPMIVLETALPIKFAATIVEATGREPDRPAKFIGIEALPKRVVTMPADVQAIKTFIAGHCA